MLLFKYLSPDGVAGGLRHADRVSLKFGLPKGYNDPYELFLSTDRPLETEEERAFYDYWIADVLQAPVSCFSLRPESVVMWAHYGRESAGVCLGFDEDTLADQFEVSFFENVEYSDEPAQVDAGLIKYALTTAKRRHTLRAIGASLRAAYFVKRVDWQYEAERRMVVEPEAVEERDGGLFCDITPDSLRFIIVGAKASDATETLCADRAKRWGVPLLRLKVGKRAYEPFFADGSETFSWKADKFEKLDAVCGDCSEPTDRLGDDGRCEWCGISAEVRDSAPRRSMLAASLHYGIDKGIPLGFPGVEPKGRWRYRRRESDQS